MIQSEYKMAKRNQGEKTTDIDGTESAPHFNGAGLEVQQVREENKMHRRI